LTLHFGSDRSKLTLNSGADAEQYNGAKFHVKIELALYEKSQKNVKSA